MGFSLLNWLFRNGAFLEGLGRKKVAALGFVSAFVCLCVCVLGSASFVGAAETAKTESFEIWVLLTCFCSLVLPFHLVLPSLCWSPSPPCLTKASEARSVVLSHRSKAVRSSCFAPAEPQSASCNAGFCYAPGICWLQTLDTMFLCV